ncbi:DegT/DnrJ/EryC1/StrS family aminotransferase [Coleofasciculus sp. H7-2]|uniref:DegT/DnrJ/EryC1/StrS family aminotransferase n=1 Tax=Coleofasciculus sp. H7-2 TaxID=3351545 RepID=UPI0036712C48
MNNITTAIPFVDLQLQHQPLQTQIEEAVRGTIQRGDFILGQAVADFEAAFASACGVAYGIGVASGTDALALGLEACGIGAGDEVILPTNTFIATLIGVTHAGATPILVDCDPQTALIDFTAAEKAVTPKTKAIVPVHLYGQMVSPRQLLDFASAHNLIVFEDAAQAHLAEREGYRAGSIGKAAAFSFYPSKNLGALGDGGMVITDDEAIAQKMRSLRNYGSSRKYYHTESGTNSRLDTLQAAVLNIKLPHLADWNQARNQAAQQYDVLLKPLANSGIFSLQNQNGNGHIYHLYVIRITKACPLDRQTIQDKLAAVGIQTGIHYPIPCHLQPAFENLGYQAGDFPQAEALALEILSLPMYPGLSDTQVHQVIDTLQTLCVRT